MNLSKRKGNALRRPYRTRARARVMGEAEKVQEKMKAEMEAMKEQMATMNHPTSNMVGKDLGSTDDPMMCKFKTSTPSHHMACLPTVHHPMWHTLSMKISITPLRYSLRANNPKLIRHISLKPWGRHKKFPTTI